MNSDLKFETLDIRAIQTIAKNLYDWDCEAVSLAGDEDQNYCLKINGIPSGILKINANHAQEDFLDYQHELLEFLNQQKLSFELPHIIQTISGNDITQIEIGGETYGVRLLSWVNGRLWKDVNPKTPKLRIELGSKAGKLTRSLLNFQHPMAERSFDWNLAQSLWTESHLDLFTSEEKQLIVPHQNRFKELQNLYKTLPRSVIHNDLNDYNILVTGIGEEAKINGFIDFGDSVYTQTVNDLAILIAYAVMDLPDPLQAAVELVRGYHKEYSLNQEELQCLYCLVAMRWITTITKAALRKNEETGNSYHLVSEQPAWDALKKWRDINEEFATCYFRTVCGLDTHPNYSAIHKIMAGRTYTFTQLFPSTHFKEVLLLDLKVSSSWIGGKHDFNDLDLFEFKINKIQKEHPDKIIAGGYLEPRPLYTATSYDKHGNEGPESRTVHLGVDFWLPAGTAVHSLFDGEVITSVNDDGFKEYGGLVILKHLEEGIPFYSLYGHLSLKSIAELSVGSKVRAGDKIGELGTPKENGHWSPHLHFQLMLDMLDYSEDYAGVCYPAQLEVWAGLCPDPNILFNDPELKTNYDQSPKEIQEQRETLLGGSLSLSYETPLHIVRGEDVYLLDSLGRKYLDTVNNVAHVGHEHPKVTDAARRQISVLNTNTRYLHEAILEYAEALIEKLPKPISVVYLVNSGSEANELALRMAKTITKALDIVALEIGYHGNTNSVIDVSSYKFDSEGGSGKPETTHLLPLPDPFRGRYRGSDSGKQYASHLKDILKSLKRYNKRPAAFIGEAILSCGGQIVPPPNFFKEVYTAIRKEGGICIADEVQTGFGRTGSHFWAFELHNVIPDIVTMGKPAGNGHPLAAVACTREVAEAFNNGLEFFNTFGGNPVSSVIGKAVLDVIEEENLQQNALETGNYLKQKLIELSEEFPIIADVRGEGLFLGIELVDAHQKPLAEASTYLVNRMKTHKILMSTDGPDHNVIKIKPPMTFGTSHSDMLISQMRKILSEEFMQSF